MKNVWKIYEIHLARDSINGAGRIGRQIKAMNVSGVIRVIA